VCWRVAQQQLAVLVELAGASDSTGRRTRMLNAGEMVGATRIGAL
jgi:hypothetical protein